jgi:DNA-binding NtrC family response regulator
VRVEDDDETRLALCDALSDLGHQVDAHHSAQSALERLENVDVDVVLSDIKMSGMNGIELCMRLSRDRPRVPVVIMTAFGDVDSALGALRAGALDFITKPFTIAQVAAALDRALDPNQLKPMLTRLAEIEQSVRSGVMQAEPEAAAIELEQASESAQASSLELGPHLNLDEVERQHILLVLKVFDWNKALAARKLGIDRATLYRKIKRYGLEPTLDVALESDADS